MRNRRRFLYAAAWIFPAAIPGLGKILSRVPKLMSNYGIEVTHTRVFAAGRNGGNPCPVVADADQLSDLEMQTLARQFGLDTAFILGPRVEDADIRIRYFVPDHEMGVSGHATIAALTVLLHHKTSRRGVLRIETSTGLFEATWIHDGSRYVITLGQNPPVFGLIVEPGSVASVLKVHMDQMALAQSPIQVVSVSRAKLLVPLVDWSVLDRLTPDFEALWELCEKQGATGLYPFTRHTNRRSAEAEARQFPLRAGFPEDAATGVAAAALGAYLARYDLGCQTGQHEFRIAQGYAMGAPSLIDAIADCANGTVNRTAIRGAADIVRRERIRIHR